ncbi:tetratricopeptide repeat protein [Kitasatospora purpeofusca]|uniref:tetratricopeptide repeat protein n=1 Tax=Kitasatospora purpeofusca TaxID=67352 RepID=UPI0030EFD39F
MAGRRHRAFQQIRTDPQHTDPAEHAAVLHDRADRLLTRGEAGQAETLLHQARQLFTDLGDTREAAITWGHIADVLQQRGEVDEALRIRHEIELPAFERIGDTRSTAVTWGHIADVLQQRGEVDEAVELQLKRLEVNERLGDIGGIAAANWDLARIDLKRGDFHAAVPRLMTSFQHLLELQRPDGIAAVGIALGHVMLAAGAHAQARQVLQTCRAAAALIGNADIVSQADELMETIGDEDDEDEES